MGYSSWRHEKLNPENILLDSFNARLPMLRGNAGQAEIRGELFALGEVQDMVRSLAQQGYFPDEPVVVIPREDGKRGYLVMEGNRRVCGCQVLLNIKRVPKRYVRSVKSWIGIAGGRLDELRRIPVVVAPDRAAVTQLVASKHVGAAKRIKWPRYAQGKYALAKLDEGLLMVDVARSLGCSGTDARNAIMAYRLIETVLALEWEENDRQIIESQIESFPLDGILKVLSSPTTKDRIGDIRVDPKEGWFEFSWPENRASEFIMKLARDSIKQLSSTGKVQLNSRIAGDAGRVGQYLDTLPAALISRIENQSEYVSTERLYRRYNDAIAHPEEDTDADKPAVPASGVRIRRSEGTRRTPRDRFLLPSNFAYSGNNDKLGHLVGEMRKTSLTGVPHLSGLALRALLEIGLVVRMKDCGRYAEYQRQIANGELKGQVGLKSMYEFAKNDQDVISDQNLRKTLDTVQSSTSRIFNMVAHNDQHVLTDDELFDARQKLMPLLRFVIVGTGNDGDQST